MSDAIALDVWLHGRSIGTLHRLPNDQTFFAFSDAYAGDDGRPTLGLAFKNQQGGLITEFRPRGRVPPFFANLLPEGVLRDYIAERAGVNAKREFFLLAQLGGDLPGAVSIHPADAPATPPRLAAGDDDEAPINPETILRFSLAGVQLKFSAVLKTGKKGGLTVPMHGVGGEWIVKLPSLRFTGVPENEFSMMTLAGAVGIEVPPVMLVPFDQIDGLPEGIGTFTGAAYATRRFDRTPDGPVHIEDFAQVFDQYPERKYEKATLRSVAHVLGIETSQDSIDEFFRRVVFSILIGNGDMHLKNWSLIYRDRRRAELAPAYDFVSTIAYLPSDGMALKPYRSRAFADVTFAELRDLADKAGLSSRMALRVATDTVERFLATWSAQKLHLPLGRAVVSAIDAHLARLPLVHPS